jgi:hypothetical protein
LSALPQAGAGAAASALILSPLVGVLLAILPDPRAHEVPKGIANANTSVKLVDDRELMRGAKRGAGWHP